MTCSLLSLVLSLSSVLLLDACAWVPCVSLMSFFKSLSFYDSAE
jgi:hypothetical protein